jgi:hypothetical protein
MDKAPVVLTTSLFKTTRLFDDPAVLRNSKERGIVDIIFDDTMVYIYVCYLHLYIVAPFPYWEFHIYFVYSQHLNSLNLPAPQYILCCQACFSTQLGVWDPGLHMQRLLSR